MTNANPKTAAVYLRVSCDRSTVENQRAVVAQMAVARGFEPMVYEEVESAVVALDRLHRSMTGAIATVLELDRLGVPALSVREGWMDTSGPVRPLLVAIVGWVAEQERAVLVERTMAGLARARREGKTFGRPRTSPVKVAAAVDHVRAGVSERVAARAAGISRSTLQRALSTA
jgi:putative DNA-invertase from lambdoid prophage Rac